MNTTQTWTNGITALTIAKSGNSVTLTNQHGTTQTLTKAEWTERRAQMLESGYRHS